jgi:hypothetical protein
MRRFFLLVVVSGLLATGAWYVQPPVAVQEVQVVRVSASLEGNYALSGFNQDGTPYGLSVRITAGADELYFLEYIEQGQLMAVGFGIRTNDVLSVVFQTATGVIGMASFEVKNGILAGKWMVPTVPGFGSEVLTPSGPIPQVARPARPADIDPGTLKV